MPVSIYHSLTATTPDNTSYEIRPQEHWNAAHAVTLNVSGSEVIGAFNNAGGVTFGLETNGSITASAPAGVPSPVNFSAGTTSNNLASVVFGNSNGVSFGLNGSTVTGSHNGLTTAMASNRGSDFVQATAAFAGTNASGTIASNGISVSIGNYLTTAMLSNAVTMSNIKVSAGTLSANRSDMTFGNSNGISFGLETNGVITGIVATNYQSQGAYLTTAALSNHSHGNPTLALTNLSGTTASASNGFTLSLSAAAPGAGGGIAAAAGTQTQTSGTVLFNNANGITFGMRNSSVITASHNGLTTAAASDHSHGNPTLALTNLSGTTASASNGFTLSLSAAAAGGGAAPVVSAWKNLDHGMVTTHPGLAITNASLSKRPFFFPIHLPFAINGLSTIDFMASRVLGTSLNMTYGFALYSLANATSMNLISSVTHSISCTTSAQFSGVRNYWFTGLGAMSLTPGHYVGALYFSGSNNSTAVANLGLMGGQSITALAGSVFPGANSTGATNATQNMFPFWGVYSNTTAAFPAGVGRSQITGMGNATVNPLPYLQFKNIT